jgi:hypothetical protein
MAINFMICTRGPKPLMNGIMRGVSMGVRKLSVFNSF